MHTTSRQVCRDCAMNGLGDEFHFNMEYPEFEEPREKFLSKKFLSPKSVYNCCRLFSARRFQ